MSAVFPLYRFVGLRDDTSKRERVSGGGIDRGMERISSWLDALSAEPHKGLKPMNFRS